jgi:hypothetical protein
MTVQEMIDLLQKVEDKTKQVVVAWDGTFDYARGAFDIKLFTNQDNQELSIWRSTNPIEVDCVLIDASRDPKVWVYSVSDSFETIKRIE